MEPHNSSPQLPPRFLRTAVESGSTVRSICNSCSSEIACHDSRDALEAAEKLHRCSVHRETALRVMVVDDDKILAQVLSEILRDAGFEVSTFNHALHAAQYALKSPPDVVVTDFRMPDIDGLVLTAWLCENYPACKVVIVSGDVDSVAEQAPSGLQFTLLQKPFLTESLIASVRSHGVHR
jgi:CheY-like chemotaxis protein